MNECSPLGRRVPPGFAPVLVLNTNGGASSTAAAARALAGGCSLVWVTALSDFDRRMFDFIVLCRCGRLDDL